MPQGGYTTPGEYMTPDFSKGTLEKKQREPYQEEGFSFYDLSPDFFKTFAGYLKQTGDPTLTQIGNDIDNGVNTY